jgi:hypothetical protein
MFQKLVKQVPLNQTGDEIGRPDGAVKERVVIPCELKVKGGCCREYKQPEWEAQEQHPERHADINVFYVH